MNEVTFAENSTHLHFIPSSIHIHTHLASQKLMISVFSCLFHTFYNIFSSFPQFFYSLSFLHLHISVAYLNIVQINLSNNQLPFPIFPLVYQLLLLFVTILVWLIQLSLITYTKYKYTIDICFTIFLSLLFISNLMMNITIKHSHTLVYMESKLQGKVSIVEIDYNCSSRIRRQDDNYLSYFDYLDYSVFDDILISRLNTLLQIFKLI